MARILIIDDDADLSHFLCRELEGQGHRVQCLDRAERGPDMLMGGAFDLVLLDNKMPGMTGIDFLEAVRGRSIEVPVLLMTGFATADTAIRATNLGAFDYIVKPADFQTLFRELEPLIAHAIELAGPVREVRIAEGNAPRPDAGPMLVGKSKPMLDVYKLIGQFARGDDPVLILGETGTGKELVARAIHTNSPRRAKPFVALNCTALNEHLLESELFGHEPGAFTGAAKLRKGKFEYASGGTLFLDEIGDMPLHLQAKLLRVLEYQEVERIGSNEPIKVDVRLLSATHRDLEAMIADGKFRRDLFFRINRVTLRLPPLRERREDLPELAAYFLARAAESDGQRTPPALSKAALDLMRAHPWLGNIRELQNVMYRAVAVCQGPQILPAHLDFPDAAPAGPGAVPGDAAELLREVIGQVWNSGASKVWTRLHDLLERELLQFALRELGGNQTQVAERIDMARGTVIKRMEKYGLK